MSLILGIIFTARISKILVVTFQKVSYIFIFFFLERETSSELFENSDPSLVDVVDLLMGAYGIEPIDEQKWEEIPYREKCFLNYFSRRFMMDDPKDKSEHGENLFRR